MRRPAFLFSLQEIESLFLLERKSLAAVAGWALGLLVPGGARATAFWLRFLRFAQTAKPS